MDRKRNPMVVKKGRTMIQALGFLHQQMYQYQPYSAILPFLACLSGAGWSLLLVLLPKYVLDAASGERQMDYRLTLELAMLGLGVTVAAILHLVSRNEIGKCAQTFVFRKLNPLWERKMLRLDYAVLLSGQGKSGAEKARQAVESPNWGVASLWDKETALLEAVAGLVVYCAIVGMLHPLALVFLALFFLVELVWGVRIEDRKQGLKEEKTRADRRLHYMAYGTRGMEAAKDIRIFSLGVMLRQIIREAIRDKNRVETKIQGWQFVRMGMTALLSAIRDGAVYLYLIGRYLHGDMTIGDFSLYFAAVTGVGMWLTSLAGAVSEFREAGHYAQDFCGFLKLPEAKDAEGQEHMEGMPVIAPVGFEWKNVSFSYRVWEDGKERKIPVFQNLSLQIKAGERLAVVGVNGAGKSTLVKLLCGLLQPDQGNICINGVDSRTLPRWYYYGLFSAVFQHSRQLPVSIAKNVMLNVRKDKEEAVLWDCLDKAGLLEKVKSLPKAEKTCLVRQISEEGTGLSGGQEQRLLLARALYKDAPVLILDEPTAALDPLAESEIYEKYSGLTEGKTALFISHRLASTRFCDRILFLEHGRIVESGSHEELMALGGKYADMFQVQSKYYADQEEMRCRTMEKSEERIMV